MWKNERDNDIAKFITYLVMQKVLETIELCNNNVDNTDYPELIWKKLRKAVEYFKQLKTTEKVNVLYNLFKLLFIRKNSSDCWLPNLTSTPINSIENLNDQDSFIWEKSDKRDNEFFMINEILMRDLLFIFKECLSLINLENSYFDVDIERKVANLSHFISEAKWRFELVGRKDIVLSAEGTTNFSDLRCDIVSKMSSTPESLAALCMINKEIYKTEQVIKLYNLEDSYLEQEFEFSKKYARTVKLINDVDRRAESSTEFDEVTDPLLEIKNLATKGLHVLEVTQPMVEIIETFPPSPFDNIATLGSDNIMTPALLSALVALDISLVSGNCKKNNIILLQHAQRILSSRYQDDKAAKKFDINFQKVQQFSRAVERRLDFDTDSNQTCRSLLCQCISPMDAENFEKYSKFEQLLSDRIRDIENALKNYSKQQTDLLIQQAKKIREEETDVIKLKPVITEAMENLIDCLKSFDFLKDGIFSIFSKDFKGSGDFRDYLGSLLTHVKELKLLTKGNNVDSVDIEYFTVLDEMPTQILGCLIFKEKIPPLKLAEVASKLNVNLTRVLVNNCCPFIPSRFEYPKKTQARVIFDSNYENKRLEDKTSSIIKECILQITQLMKADEKPLYDLTALFELSKSKETWKVLERTKILKYSQLIFYDKEDEIAFWINLHNLLMIESLLYELKVNRC